MNASVPDRNLHQYSSSKRRTNRASPAFARRVRALMAFLAADMACITVCFIGAAWLRGSLSMGSSWVVMLAVLLPTHAFVALNAHAYTPSRLQDPYKAVAKGLQALLMAITAIIFIAYALKNSDAFPRMVILIGTMLTVVTMATARYLLSQYLLAVAGGSPYTIILLRDGDAAVPDGNFEVIPAANFDFEPDRHDPNMYDRLARSLSPADRVIVACPPERRTAWAHALKGANIQSEIFVPELDALAPLGMARCGREPTIIIANGPLGLVDRVIKRGFDVALAGAALLVLAPLFAIIAVAIKFDSDGAVFFRQIRIGRGNEMFRMLKFRSMKAEGCDGAGDRSTAREDDRVTRVGNFIRKTSLDELPQLLNVLKGDMSVVGPRPHALGSRAADKLFWEVDTRYWHRHATKPGLTGLAQIRGYRGATIVEDDLRNRLQADLEYLENWSIWRDVKIIAMTFRVLLHRNAF